jgi:hypothetical protein
MDAELRSVSEHMLMLGLGALAHANWHANYDSHENRFWPELSVIQAAHAAEILVKARIAQEHPLLIFERLPKADDAANTRLSLSQLLETGRTYQYADLPNRLWATTGITVPNLQRYQSFGRLRNSIQHFTSPDRDVSLETVEFIYEVIDPFIHVCWGLFAVDYNEDYEHPKYLVEGLIRRGIRFLISAEVVEDVKKGYIDFEWPKGDEAYKEEMETRIEKARKEENKRGKIIS